MVRAERREIVIVGAGPAGSALAFFLARAGRDALLVDRAEFPRDKTCGDALSPRALDVLGAMGVAAELAPSGAVSRRVRFVAPCGDAAETAIPGTDDEDGRVLALPRRTLDDRLRRRAIEAGASFRGGCRVEAPLVEGGRVVGFAARDAEGPLELRCAAAALAVGAALPLVDRCGLAAKRRALGAAARLYARGDVAEEGTIEFFFDGVPLPGYGWIFPVGPGLANVGAGRGPARRTEAGASARRVFDSFVASASIAPRLADARLDGPPRAFPLRFDFLDSPLARPGLVLVGEAAGLVNPLSGEGIDFALESGRLAAESMAEALAAGASPEETARRHAAALRRRCARWFRGVLWVRDLYLRRAFLDRLIRAARRRPELARLLAQIALGTAPPRAAFAPATILKLVAG